MFCKDSEQSPFKALCIYMLGVFGLIAKYNETIEPNVIKAELLTMFVVGLLMSAVTMVLSELIRPKPDIENAKPASKGDFRFPTAVENRPVPLIWGKVKLAGPNVTWWGDFRQFPVRETIKTGLWSKKRVTTGFEYFVGIDMALCRGGVTPVSFHRLFIGDKEVGGTPETDIDEPTFLGGNDFGSGGIVSSVEFFPGSTTQVASTYLTGILSPDPVSGQRGTAHYVFEGGYIGNTTQIKPFAFELSRFPSLLLDDATTAGEAGSYTAGENIILSDDCNPMEALYECIVDDDWGMGKSSSVVDLANFADAANTLHTEENGFGFQLERGLQVSELIDLLQKQMDAVLFQDRRTGKYQIRLARQDYTPNLTATSVTGTNTYNVPSDGTTMVTDQVIYAAGFDNASNNGRKTVVSSTATTVVVSNALVNETPSGDAFGGARISELNGIDDANKIEVREFARQTWDGTANQIRVGFADRSREYFETFARSDSLGSQRSQNNETVTTTINYPGVKLGDLATKIAARELRFLSFPFAKATVLTNRQMWDVNPGDPIRWTSEALGIVDLVMRITRVDFGNIAGEMTLSLVQDIFSLEAGFFGNPPTPLWELPTQGVLPIDLDEHQVFEAPKAIVDRDVLFPGRPDRVFVGARAQSGETAIRIYQRNDTVTPTGDYAVDGQNEGMFLIGSLNVGLTSGDANPTTTIQLSASPDSQTRILFAMDPDGATPAEIGQQLANIIKIGDEFIGFESAAANGALIDLTNCYRGLMHSVPADHTASDLVYLLFVSGGLSDTTILPGNIIDVQPRTVSRDEELTEGNSKTFQLTMNNVYRRPYPPFALDINGSPLPSSVSLDTAITNPGADDKGLDIEWFRRDFETTDEVLSLTADAETLDAGFQAKNNHLNKLSATVTDDSLVLDAASGTFAAGNTDVISRADAIWKTDGDIPSSMAVSLDTRHTVSSVDYDALQSFSFSTTPTSAELAALTNLGTTFANGGPSILYTTLATGTYVMTLETSITSGQFRINGGAWTNLPITATVSTDTLEFRHTDNGGSPANTIGILANPSATDVAYVVFNTETEFEALVGYWTMNDASDVDRVARFGGAPDLADNNTVAAVTGKFGSAARLQMNGATPEYLSLPSAQYSLDMQLDYTIDWTISMWVKHATGTTVTAGSPHSQGFLFRGVWTSDISLLFLWSSSLGYGIITYDGTGSGTGTEDGRANATLGATSGTEDVWHLLTATYDTSGNSLELHLDGVLQSNGADKTPNGVMNQPTTAEDVLIGQVNGGTFGSSLVTGLQTEDTAIDDVRIYHRRMLTAEILAMFNATQPIT